MKVVKRYFEGFGSFIAIVAGGLFIWLPLNVLGFLVCAIWIIIGPALGVLLGFWLNNTFHLIVVSVVVGIVLSVIWWYTIWFINEEWGVPFSKISDKFDW